MKIDHNQLGCLGEEKAAKFLKKSGYKILERNFKNSRGKRFGELDIIAYDKKSKEVVFVEVKSRLNKPGKTIIPEENITYSKLIKLQKIAQIYLMQKHWQNRPYRFDAIAINFDEVEKPTIRHIVGL